MLPGGYMYLCKIEAGTNNFSVYPLYNPSSVGLPIPYMENMQPHKIFLDEAEKTVYVIGNHIRALPIGLGASPSVVPFIVKV